MPNSQAVREPTGLEVAIVGASVRFPGASDLDGFWRLLRDGTEAISFFSAEETRASTLDPIPADDPQHVRAAGVVVGIEDFDAAFFSMSPREAEATDPQHRLFLECAWEAIETAGYGPDLYTGRIGVYASAGTNTYLLNNLCANRTFLGMSNALQMIIGNDKDYLATRVSYKLNLRGPSLMVQTACSSSLVAVHTACQALLDGDCDMALAGGASINVPQTAGYRYQDGSIGSPDGHCRPFDADACGTVKSSGAGIVLLKRLEEALADGDTILAVIRGSAVNNDGSAKVSFSAPSAEGQAEAIEAALRVSEVDPESIAYIEAHGTGTRVGDPIEFAALERAFRARRSDAGTCAIGSVKSNLGHLDAAAGVAGLIKTALALQHREIPPSLHYRRPNPNIDFAATPFRVAAALEPWPDQTGPRCAGVSSFGIGGTNCHVVLEEPPFVARTDVAPGRPQLLLLSACTRTALDRMSDRLATRLDGATDETLADAAYTLQVGRNAFPWRRALVATSAGEAVASLRGGARTDAVLAGAPRPKIALLLPGQGTQRPGMGARLYEDDPRFHALVDDCATRFAPLIDFDLRRVFQTKAENERVIGDALARTSIAQPALFTIEYAMALLLKEWRIPPDAMIGHSLGELVAACLAGVFSLEDAVRIVAARGRLMQTCPPGAMTAVRLSEAEVASRLPPDLSLAAVNGTAMCVVSGSLAAIERFEGDCRALGVQTQRLPVSHGFHSLLMEPMLPAFRDALMPVRLRAPTVPFISNVTGRFITDAEATDPEYWIRQIRAPVRFHEGLSALIANESWALVETGPGDVLSRLAKPCALGRPGVSIHCCLGERDDDTALLCTVGQLWCRGVEIDRARLSPEPRRRIPLPTYPFEKKRFWIDPEAPTGEGPARFVPAPSPADLVASHRADDDIASLDSNPAAPMTATELFVARLWREALGVETIGPHDDFFALGGDSILGLQVTFRARQAGVGFSPAQLLQHSTVVALAREIERAGDAGDRDEGAPARLSVSVDLPEIVSDPSTLHEPFPLTDVQQAYWIGRSGLAGSGPIAAHVYQEYEGKGLDLARLESALDRLISRHDALRSITTPDGRQRILAKVPRYKIVVSDLTGADPQAAQATLLSCRERMSHQVHASDRWPLFEVRASLLPGDVVRLHLSIDILFTDAWSLVILGRELLHLYADPVCRLEPLEIAFRDYVIALETLRDGDLFRESRRYWMARLAELPSGPALPLADTRAPAPPRFTRRSATLDTTKWNALKSRGKLAGLTPAMILCAAYAEVLTIWSAAPRFCLNLPLFNRLPLHPDVNAVLGDFTSVVLLEVDNSEIEPFEARAKRLQRRLWDDLEHRHFSGVAVLRELAHVDAARAFMPVVFTSLILPGGANSASEAEAQFGKTVYSVSQTPQVWLDHQVAEEGDGLLFNWDSVDARFPANLVEEMFAAYCRLLDVLAQDPGAWTDIEACRRVVLPMVDSGQIAPTAGATPSSLLHEDFFRRAESDPDRPAVLTAGAALTYGELALRARQVARLLGDTGGAERRIAIVMEKGWAQLAGVFGILWTGAAYVPIDPDFPIGYVHALLEEVDAACVLTQPSVAARLRWPDGMRVVEIEDASLAGVEPHAGTPVADADALAYIIYTSGTTGRPKGVMIDHRGALNTISDINARFAVGVSDRVLALSALNFDLSVYDIFGPLSAGAAVILPDPKAASVPSHWLTLAVQFDATIWNSVPALAVLFAEAAEAAGGPIPPLRLALLSGDWIPLRLPERLTHRFPGARIVSLGGATEASIWSILYEIDAVDPSWKSIPYGKALARQSMHVLDANLDPRPIHVQGALFIGGGGLAMGYWRNAGETEHRFVVHPRTGERLYRTGDLGRLMSDGNIEFLGREDFQVKIHGHRIELGEIESVLERDPSIERAVVAVRVSAGGAKTLVAYVVSKFVDDPPMSIEMRSFLEGHLPGYMVPSAFVVLPALPLTANGKVDRQSLPEPEVDDAPREILLPSTETERRLAAIWSNILEIAVVAIDRNFFEIGGDSLLATRMMVAMQNELEVDVTLRTIFEHPTIASLAGILDSFAGESNRGSAIARAPRTEALPVSAAQGRLWFADRLSPGDSTYNFSVALLLRGVLETDVLARSLEEIVRRHEVLRTTFGEIDGVPVQVIGDRHDVPIWTDDASDRRMTELDRKHFFETALNEEARFAFDLVHGPLFRARLLRFSSQDSILLLTMHHLVTDAWSMAILVEEVATLYAAFSAGAVSPLPELTLQYADYAAWEQREIAGEAMGRQLEYWMELLSSGAPWLRLPEDHSDRPALPNNGARSAFRLSAASLAALKQLCVAEDATLFMGLLAIWQLLLHYYSRQKDILVGSPSANRDQAEIAGLIGVFVNTLVMKAHFASGAMSFRELLAEVREAAIEAYANQRVPYDRVVDEFWRRRPFETRRGLFRVWFVLQNVPIAPPVLGDLAITPLEANSLMAVHDLKLSAVEDDDGLACAIDFRVHLFEPETIKRMTSLFAFLVDDLTAQPGRSLDETNARLASLGDAAQKPPEMQPEAAHFIGVRRSRRIVAE